MKRGKILFSDKKGSHVGVVISFVIFVTFLLFIYSILEPSINTKNRAETELKNIEKKIIPAISDNLTSTTIDVGNSENNCLKISDWDLGNNVVVKNGEEVLGVSISSLESEELQIESAGVDFFKIYSSGSLPKAEVESVSCVSVSDGAGYELGLVKEAKYIFESKISELLSNYENYEMLKQNLSIPEDIEFGVGFVSNNGSFVETSINGNADNLYIIEIPISYVDADANILPGFLRLKAW